MRSLSRLIVFALGLAMASGSVAHALNFCFNPGTLAPFDSLAVAEKFKKPARNTCTAINGFDLVATLPTLVTGTACLNAAGDTLRVVYMRTTTPKTPTIVWVTMSLPYPLLAGGDGHMVFINGIGNQDSSNAHANPCIPSAPPVP